MSDPTIGPVNALFTPCGTTTTAGRVYLYHQSEFRHHLTRDLRIRPVNIYRNYSID